MKELNIQSVKPVVPPSLPTIRQWLKTVGEGKIAQAYIVTKVWLPNQFENFTFETEKFKARVDAKSPVYESLKSLVPEWYREDVALAIAIDEARDGTFRFVELNENVDWQQLGGNGYLVKICAKRDSAKPVSSAKKNGGATAS